jgi:DNA helicase HerA-like ATPase
VERGKLPEKTQLVWTSSQVGSQLIRFYGIIEEVFRRSRRESIGEEMDVFDGDLSYEPPFNPEGVTFAEVTILEYDPPRFTPPLEQSLVYLSGVGEAEHAYGFASMREAMRLPEREVILDWRLPVGLLRNGGEETVGPAYIDIRDLNGDRAGHLNVTGQAGRGTKSSLLLVIVRSLINFAQQWDSGDPSHPSFSVRPIIFNVKGNDLMYIDMPNRGLNEARRQQWRRLGIDPQPFTETNFFSPCEVIGRGDANRGAPRVQRPVVDGNRQTRTYYWTLADVIRFGLWQYLFSESAQQSETLMSLVDHLQSLLSAPHTINEEYPSGLELRQEPWDMGNNQRYAAPQSFQELREFLQAALRDQNHPIRDGGIHTFATIRALLSRLGPVFGQEGRSIFDPNQGIGRPLRVIGNGTSDPLVIDIAGLPPELRRFVVASVLDQIKDHQMSENRQRGQVYFLILDEMALYAPRGARDPITRLFEFVAAQLRSQGIILLSAQQQASDVSETVFGNSQFKALGATSPVELESSAWNRLLTPPQKARAMMLQPDEKMILTHKGWMNVVVPFPAWAMKESEADFSVNAHPTHEGGLGELQDLITINPPED